MFPASVNLTRQAEHGCQVLAATVTRVRSLVKDVAVVPQLPEDAALVVSTSPAVVDLAVGVDVEATYLGLDEAGHNTCSAKPSP